MRAAPCDLRRRYSQLRRVTVLMPRTAENLFCESPNRSRMALTSGSSYWKERFGFAVPFKIRPPSLMLSTNSAKSSFSMEIFETRAERIAFVLLWKSSRQDIADPDIFIERLPPEGSPLHPQDDLLEHFRRSSRESGKL